jgi:hypothetical protein
LQAAEDDEVVVELAADADVQPDAVVVEAEAALVAGVAVLGRLADVQVAKRAVDRPRHGVGLVELHPRSVRKGDPSSQGYNAEEKEKKEN